MSSSDSDFYFSSEPLEGWRVFKLARAHQAGELFDAAANAPAGVNPFEWARRPRLQSVGVHATWPVRQPMVGHCLDAFGDDEHVDGAHPAPHRECECGLWILKSYDDAVSTARNYTTRIVARVKLWGRFVELEKGWRAQYGYPVEVQYLGLGKGSDQGPMRDAEAAARLYGCSFSTAKLPPPPKRKRKPKGTGKAINPTFTGAWSANITPLVWTNATSGTTTWTVQFGKAPDDE